MPIEVITGRAGSCKTAMLCQRLMEVLQRNIKYNRRTKKIRKCYTNFPLSPAIEAKYKNFLGHWKDLDELLLLTDADIFIDEIMLYFDAVNWKALSYDAKRFIAIHRHLGIEIYGTSQDFSQVDIAFRRLTDKIFYLVKIASSPEPSATKPPIKRIWGLSIIYTISPVDYKEDQKENKTSFHWFFWLTRKKCEIYDTRQKFEKSAYTTKKEQVEICEKGDACTEGYQGKPWRHVSHI